MIAGSDTGQVVITSAASGYACSLQWARWTGAGCIDVAVKSAAGSGNSSPSLSSGTLGSTGELVLVFAGSWKSAGTLAETAPVWTSGFTPISGTDAAQQGTSDTNSVDSWGAYNRSAGTGAVSAGASWSGSAATETVTLLVSFKPGQASVFN